MTNSDRAFVELKAMERTRKIVLLSYDHQIKAAEENLKLLQKARQEMVGEFEKMDKELTAEINSCDE